MRFGFVVPFGDGRSFASLAALGEEHGWDGVFTYEAVYGVYAWAALAAAAMTTSRVTLGTLLTPAARWRPWDLASAAGTVGQLSGGRAVMAVGLGAVHEGWTAFEPDEGRQVRARRLDECLDIYAGLLGGPPFSYNGTYYTVLPTDFMSPPDTGRPPVWVVGVYQPGRSRQPSLERAARWDGLLPGVMEAGEQRPAQSPGELADIVGRVAAGRSADVAEQGQFDVVIEADSYREFIALDPPSPGPWAEAGATWWMESWWLLPRGEDGLAELKRRITAGPPAL
jgi:alkanesulfonate monooxygenase SsuD/methylene tetrahydromethanopterin reductase-like flavin-dependent oxidoreductase (luciferase family)